MTLFRRYMDEDVPVEVGGQYGRYEASLSADGFGVEVHFFRQGGELIVYVTKSPGVTMATAQRVAMSAVEHYERASALKARQHFLPQLDYR